MQKRSRAGTPGRKETTYTAAAAFAALYARTERPCEPRIRVRWDHACDVYVCVCVLLFVTKSCVYRVYESILFIGIRKSRHTSAAFSLFSYVRMVSRKCSTAAWPRRPLRCPSLSFFLQAARVVVGSVGALVELGDAEPTWPGALGWRGERRRQAVHVVASVAVVAEQQLVLWLVVPIRASEGLTLDSSVVSWKCGRRRENGNGAERV